MQVFGYSFILKIFLCKKSRAVSYSSFILCKKHFFQYNSIIRKERSPCLFSNINAYFHMSNWEIQRWNRNNNRLVCIIYLDRRNIIVLTVVHLYRTITAAEDTYFKWCQFKKIKLNSALDTYWTCIFLMYLIIPKYFVKKKKLY